MARTPRAKFEITAEDKTRAAFDRVERGFRQVRDAGLAVAGVGAALTAVTVRAVGTADALAKSARAAGFTGERFQELIFTGSQLGIQQEAMTSNLERFTKRIGEAANGTGAAAKMYEQLGIEVVDANGRVRDSDAILRDVAEAMQRLETDAERSAAAAALFGREGIRLGAALAGGPAVIDDLARTARELGLVLDEDLLTNAEAASDQLDRMQRIVSAQATVLGAELFPAVIQAGNAFASAVPHIRQFFDLLNQESELRLFGQIAHVRERMDTLREIISGGDVPLEIFGMDTGLRRPGRDSDLGPAVRELEALEEVLETLEQKRTALQARTQADAPALIDPASLLVEGEGEGRLRGGEDADLQREQEKTERLLEAQQTRFERLREARLTAEQRDVELENERFEREIEKLAEEREMLLENELVTEEQKAELRAQFRQAEEDAHAEHTGRLNEISRRRAQEQQRIDDQLARQQERTADRGRAAVVASLQGLMGQSNAIKVAMLAFEKGKAIADVVVLTQVAAARALAELGPIAGPPAAAAIKAAGAASVGLIAAQGIAEAGGAGGGAGGGGSFGGGSFARSAGGEEGGLAGGAPAPFIDQRGQNAGAVTLQVNITQSGVIATSLQDAAQELEPLLIEGIGRAISDRDVVLIEPNSRQALELQTS